MNDESDPTKSVLEMLSRISNPLREHREWMASISDPLKEHRELIASMADPLKDHREWMASISDPLKEHRELIASMADPLKDHREWMASISDPLKEHRELIASMADPLKANREWMTSISDPLKEHRELIASMADPLKDHREWMASISDPLKENRELIASMADPLKANREWMTSISDPLKEHRELIASISNPFKEINASILALTSPLKEISISDINSLISLKDIAAAISNDLSFESEGIISLDSKRLTASELQDLSIQLINNSSLKQSDTLEGSLNALIEEIRSQKDPITQKLLMWFVFPLIITVIASFINPIVDAQVKSYLKQDKRSLSKKIESNFANSLSNKTLLKDFRYVTADVLTVRYSATQKSKTIGYLYFGYAVIVVDRQKNWTLIEWNDPDSKVRMTGWVFSRYLVRFR